MFGLSNFLGLDPGPRNDGTSALWQIGKDFYAPGFWVSFAAKARNEGIRHQQIRFSDAKGRGYSEAMKLQMVLDGVDDYPNARRNEGQNYSPLVLLENEESTDSATQTVNGCIRTHFAGLGFNEFTNRLCEVVGDLHDNVWSHGKSTGFSMAQKWHKPRSDNDVMFEFALADCGLGFFRELKRVGLKIENDASAINWCIQKGNSSKLVNEKQDDGWAQRLPPDLVGASPMPLGIGRVKESDNHHQGLGLAKLVSLVDDYKGSLWLATGKTMLAVKKGKKEFKSLAFPWQGVCLACRFDGSLVKQYQTTQENDELTDTLMRLLGGGDENESI